MIEEGKICPRDNLFSRDTLVRSEKREQKAYRLQIEIEREWREIRILLNLYGFEALYRIRRNVFDIKPHQ